MAKLLNYMDQVEAYLDGSMASESIQSFEARMASDPLLKQEVEVQREIIEGLRSARKAELKSMLNEVPVSTGYLSAGIKAASVIAVGLLLGTGGYYIYQDMQSSKTEISQVEPIVHEERTVETLEIPADENKPTSAESTASDSGIEQIEPDVLVDQSQSEIVDSSPQATEEESLIDSESIIASAERPEFLDSVSDDPNAGKSVTKPEISSGSKEIASVSTVAFETRKHRKYTFHYQFDKNNTLILYADFDNKPFEILEINSKSGRSLYLDFNNTFFPIDDSEKKVQPLEPLADKQLIQELRIIQKNKSK